MLALVDGHGRHLLAGPRRHRDLSTLRQLPVPLTGLARLALLSMRLGYQDPKALLASRRPRGGCYAARRLAGT